MLSTIVKLHKLAVNVYGNHGCSFNVLLCQQPTSIKCGVGVQNLATSLVDLLISYSQEKSGLAGIV